MHNLKRTGNTQEPVSPVEEQEHPDDQGDDQEPPASTQHAVDPTQNEQRQSKSTQHAIHHAVEP